MNIGGPVFPKLKAKPEKSVSFHREKLSFIKLLSVNWHMSKTDWRPTVAFLGPRRIWASNLNTQANMRVWGIGVKIERTPVTWFTLEMAI